MTDNQGLITVTPGNTIIHPGGSLTMECSYPPGRGCGAVLKITAPQGPEDQIYWAKCPFCGNILAEVHGGPPIIEVVRGPVIVDFRQPPIAKIVIFVGGGILALILLWKILK
jgi:hypothetical protein